MKAFARGLLPRYNNWMFDCDGVLWSSGSPVAGSVEAVARLKESGKNTVFVTNNATKSRQTYVEKFHSLGFKDVSLSDINTSASAAAEHCRTMGFGKVFAIGEVGLFEELRECDVEVVYEAGAAGMNDSEFEAVALESGVDAVVVGWDSQFSYKKLCLASLYLQGGAKLVVTNPDAADRYGDRLQPGTGCSAAAILASMDDPDFPYVVTGKPNAEFLEQLLEKYDFDPSDTIMCGDRVDTDVRFGAGRIDTLLVLSGVSTEAHLEALPPESRSERDNAAAGRPSHIAETVFDAL
eukprot:g276.t1